MAAVLSFDSGAAPSIGEVNDAFGQLIGRVRELPARAAVPMIQDFRGQLCAVEADLLAALIPASGDTKAAERIVAKAGKVTKRAKRKAVGRAKLNAKNPTVGKKMAAGELTDEQADLIADADSKTNGAAGADDDFIAAIAAAGPDQAKGVAADYVSDNTSSADAKSEHDRQRSQRTASRFKTDNRLDAIMLAGDKASIALAWAQADKLADSYYRHDSGRDLPIGSHPRTRDQRLFDAFMHLLGGGGKPADNQWRPRPDRRSPCRDTGSRPPLHPPAAPSTRHSPRGTRLRPAVVVSTTLDKLLGLAPDAAAELIGTGPIADSVIAGLLPDADIVGLVHHTNGQPIWLGLNIRLAGPTLDMSAAPSPARPGTHQTRTPSSRPSS